MKKLIRFILAVIMIPVYIPLWAISVILIFITESLSSYPRWDFYKEYHFKSAFKWYLFK